MEPVEVARRINHSLRAVERYLQTFARVAFLEQKGFDSFSMAMTMGISVAGVKTYQAVFNEHRHRPQFQRRLQEIEIIGGKYYETQDFQKGGPSPRVNAQNGWRKP
jgi:DNA-binding IclR family transcriptional regulator